MLHPSYTDLMRTINSEVEEGDTPVVNSRYSIVLAAAKRARQLVDGSEPLVDNIKVDKPVSIAVNELYNSKIKIISHNPDAEEAVLAEAAESQELSEISLDNYGDEE